jgi:hypothetical protein
VITKLNQENSSKKHDNKVSGLLKHDLINLKTGATALHQSAQGGAPPSYTLSTWMVIKPMPTKVK